VAPGHSRDTRSTRGNGIKALHLGATAGCQGAKSSLLIECFTKKWEKKKNKKAKVEESDDNYIDTKGPSIKSTKIRIRKTQHSQKGHFEYDTAANYHTIYELEYLINVQYNLYITLKVYDESESVCKFKEMLVIKHNRKTIWLEEYLYNLSYGNIISRLRVLEDFVIKVKEKNMTVKSRRKLLYKIEQHEQRL